MTPKESARGMFPAPTKKKCSNKGCEKSVTLCLGCLQRGCRHKLANVGYLDVTTGEDQGPVSFKRLMGESDRLLSLGVCSKCRTAKGAISRERGIAAIMALLTEKRLFVSP